ncbi:MAG: DUF2784 domain-containing protein [Puniceicoccaceae bacterium]
MIFAILATATMVLHFAFILYAVFGAAGVWFAPRTAWIHIPVFIWAGGIMFSGWICPLTPLENHWRDLAGQEGFDGSFIEHYIGRIVYPPGLTRGVQILLGILVLTWNGVLYGLILRRFGRKRPASAGPAAGTGSGKTHPENDPTL